MNRWRRLRLQHLAAAVAEGWLVAAPLELPGVGGLGWQGSTPPVVVTVQPAAASFWWVLSILLYKI